MTQAQQLYLTIGQHLPKAVESQFFGKPCFKVNGKALVSFFQDAMVFKLNGEVHQEALALDGAHLFDPSGKNRPMKEWVQVPYAYHEQWERFAREAMKYVEQSINDN